MAVYILTVNFNLHMKELIMWFICMFYCLVEAQMMMCSCSEIPTTMDSSGSALGGSGVDMLSVTGMYAIVTLLLVIILNSVNINFLISHICDIQSYLLGTVICCESLVIHISHTFLSLGVSIHRTGLLDWNTGLEYWTGLLD